MSIPENYRQLSREQIESRFAGLSRPHCHVQLIRLEDPEPRVVFEGERELYLMWSDEGGGQGKPRKLKPGEPRRLALITLTTASRRPSIYVSRAIGSARLESGRWRELKRSVGR